MIDLDLIRYKEEVRIKKDESGKDVIFCPVRRKWLVALPEEWVRQLLFIYLVQDKNWPKGRLGMERSISSTSLKRWDMLAYHKDGTPLALIECKRPEVKLDWKTLFQSLSYNEHLRARSIILTNGIGAYCYLWDHEKSSYTPHDGIPEWSQIELT